MPRIKIVCQGKETVYDKVEDVTTIGRNDASCIPLSDPAASNNHCRIEKGPGGFILVDLGGKNGTRVNGNRVERHTLKAGDTIQIGASTLVFQGNATTSAHKPRKALIPDTIYKGRVSQGPVKVKGNA